MAPAQLSWWSWKLKTETASPVLGSGRDDVGLVEVEVTDSSPMPSAVSVHMGAIRLEVPMPIDPIWLAALVRELDAC